MYRKIEDFQADWGYEAEITTKLFSNLTDESLDQLDAAGMRVVLQQNERALKYKDRQTIVAWMHNDEPDNAQSLGQGKGYGPPVAPEKIVEDYKRMRNHKWYMSGRMITVHDIYSFDPNVHVELEEFTDIIGRNFRQPKEGLGFDGSPVAHMWRSMIWPNNFL